MDRALIRCPGTKLMENLLTISHIWIDVYPTEYLTCNTGGSEKKRMVRHLLDIWHENETLKEVATQDRAVR